MIVYTTYFLANPEPRKNMHHQLTCHFWIFSNIQLIVSFLLVVLEGAGFRRNLRFPRQGVYMMKNHIFSSASEPNIPEDNPIPKLNF